MNQSNLFVLIFLVSSALSLAAGLAGVAALDPAVARSVQGVSAVISGNYAHRVAVSGGDELAQLSSTFNHMTERLGELHHLEAQLRRRGPLARPG